MKIGKLLITLVIAMFVVAAVVAFMFGYQIAGSTEANKQAGFCLNCHEMRPSYYTWKVTSHNKVGCLKCHTDIKYGSFIYKHWKNVIANPIEKSNTIIPDGACRACHAPSQRNFSPPGDVIFPHELHVVKQIDCVDCHSNVAHLLVPEYIKKEFNDKQKTFDYAAFDEKQAAKLIKKGNQIEMPVCMRCHNGDMATDECVACHSTPKEKTPVTEKKEEKKE